MGEADRLDRLDADERKTLLRLARASLEQEITGRAVLDALLADLIPTPGLEARRGAFVTLHRRPDNPGGPAPLRGCIGHIKSERPLYRTVILMATMSGLNDPRFQPVRADELPDLTIEVSALTPLTPVDGPEGFNPGPDGVQIQMRGRRAVFLPQVAEAEGWTREETLGHLCLKAGLERDDWRSPEARFQTFQAEVFSEED